MLVRVMILHIYAIAFLFKLNDCNISRMEKDGEISPRNISSSFSEEVNSRDSIISHNLMVGKNLQIKIRIDLLL